MLLSVREMKCIYPLGISRFRKCLLDGVYVPCINRMPGGVIVGDSGLCCCVSLIRVTSIVRALLTPFVDLLLLLLLLLLL